MIPPITPPITAPITIDVFGEDDADALDVAAEDVDDTVAVRLVAAAATLVYKVDDPVTEPIEIELMPDIGC